MAVDQLQEIVPLHIATASETSNPFITLPGPVTGQTFYTPYKVRIQFSDALQASGSGVWTFSAQISYDRGGSWVTNVSGSPITLSATAQDGQQVLNVNPNLPTNCGQIWLWVLATLSGSPVSPVLAYRADLLQ
jgi:hypothetical protein